MEVFSWLYAFVGWLRNFVGVQQDSPPPWLQRFVSEDGQCELLLLQDESVGHFPGVVSVWQVCHDTASSDLILILCNLAQIRAEIRQSRLRSAEHEQWKRAFEVRAQAALKEQKDVLGSHLFMTGWLSKEAARSRVVDGRLEHYRHLEAGVCYVLNLQDLFSDIGDNRTAAKIIRAIAFKTLNTTPTKVLCWEELFKRFEAGKDLNWLTWLDFYSNRHPTTRFGVRPHILQPRRMVRSPKQRRIT